MFAEVNKNLPELAVFESMIGENPDVTKTGNGEWGMGNGELKWEIENGKLNFFYINFL